MFNTMSQNEKAAKMFTGPLQFIFIFNHFRYMSHLIHEKEMNIENQNVYLTLKKFIKKNIAIND